MHASAAGAAGGGAEESGYNAGPAIPAPRRSTRQEHKAMADTIFGKIIRREIPAAIVHEDEQCMVIRDVNPQAPVHLLVLPREPLARLSEAGSAHQALLGHLLLVAARVAREQGFGDAFRLVVNNGAGAGQTVFHLHVHVLAGRPLSWPPG